jgi:hypothetical protein
VRHCRWFSRAVLEDWTAIELVGATDGATTNGATKVILVLVPRCYLRDLNLRRFWPYDRKSRRAQLSIRYGDRNYDRGVAGLGTGKAQRHFASDFDRLPLAYSTLAGSQR